MATNFDNVPATADNFVRAVSGDPLNVGTQTQIVNGHSDGIEAIEKRMLGTLMGGYYVPTAYGNGLTTFGATWTVFYWDLGALGFISVSMSATANWAGSGYIEINLPPGWTSAGVESVIGMYGYPQPISGAHFFGIGLVHASATRMRFVANIPGTVAGSGVTGSPVAVASTLAGAVNGVNTPLAFTGPTNPTLMFASGFIAKLP